MPLSTLTQQSGYIYITYPCTIEQRPIAGSTTTVSTTMYGSVILIRWAEEKE